MKIIAMCGLDCGTCPAYRAHVTDDWALREATAREWSAGYGFEAKPEMIDCVSCAVVEGVHVGYCLECAIRKCGLGRGVANCAVCELFEGCATLGEFLAKVPLAKANLESVRASAAPKAEAKPAAGPKPTTKPKPKSKIKPKAKAKAKAKPKVKANAKAEAKPKAKPKARPKPKPKPKKPVKRTRRSR